MELILEKWNEILRTVKEEHELSDISFDTWLKPLTVYNIEGNKLYILVPSEQMGLNYITKKYTLPIKVAIAELTGIDYDIEFILQEQTRTIPAYKSKDPAFMRQSGKSNLNPNYTFETFVVGPSNKLACSAARAVADAPGQHYNPLFIYGDSGLGKTHLLYAIAHVIRQNNRSARIVYIKGDEFINDFIESVRTGKAGDFRTKYREADLMLVDDIQFVAGKVETQNEFFHTFNTLYESKKQIVLTSDRPPHEMAQLDDRLRTRFEWGLLVDVQPPDLETRIAIIKNKAAQLGIVLTDEIAAYIAAKITANVRQLEGTVKKIKAFRDLEGSEIDKHAVDRAIQDMSKSNEFIITPDSIIKEICRYFRLEEDQIRGQSRSRDCVNARQIAMYLIRRMTSNSLSDTGMEFSGRDHTTVLHSIEQVEKKMKKDPAFAETVKAIITNINSKK